MQGHLKKRRGANAPRKRYRYNLVSLSARKAAS